MRAVGAVVELHDAGQELAHGVEQLLLGRGDQDLVDRGLGPMRALLRESVLREPRPSTHRVELLERLAEHRRAVHVVGRAFDELLQAAGEERGAVPEAT